MTSFVFVLFFVVVIQSTYISARHYLDNQPEISNAERKLLILTDLGTDPTLVKIVLA